MLEISEIITKTVTIITKVPKELTVELSIELLTLIGLPLMGFCGKPLSYVKDEDTCRSFTRELLLRILKGFDQRRASSNLSLFE